MTIKIYTKSEWGGRAAKSGAASQTISKITRVTIHHTTGSSGDGSFESSAKLIRGHQNYHMNTNGWKDLGYHYIVDKKGRIFAGLSLSKVGAHAAGHNTNNIGIAYLGDSSSTMPAAAKAAIKELYGYLVTRVGKNLAIYGHRDLNATACPGNASYNWLKAEGAVKGKKPVSWRPVKPEEPVVPPVVVPEPEPEPPVVVPEPEPEPELPIFPEPEPGPQPEPAEPAEPNEGSDLGARLVLVIRELFNLLMSIFKSKG